MLVEKSFFYPKIENFDLKAKYLTIFLPKDLKMLT